MKTLLLVLLAIGAHAASVNLAWHQHPQATVTGYKLYYGTDQSRTVLDVGNVTNFHLPNLAPATFYYFALSAYTDQVEGDLCPEISWMTGRDITLSIQEANSISGPWRNRTNVLFETPTNTPQLFFRLKQ